MGGQITLRREDSVATLEIDNPAQRNALTPAMLAAIPERLRELAEDGQTRAVLLRGSGGVFSSGYAVDHIGAGADLPYPDEIGLTCQAIERSPLVVTAVLEGFTVGAALEVACACDFRLALAGTRLGITPAKLGLVYSWTGMARVARVVGLPATRELFLSAALVDAERAAGMGLVGAVHANVEELEEAAQTLCERIASLAPLSLAGSKRVLYEIGQALRLTEPLALELHGLRATAMDSQDAGEARAAFSERRPPRFTGR